MADKQKDNSQDSSPSMSGGTNNSTNTFHKGMIKDYNELFIGDGLYTHARNAVNNSHDGQVGVIGNEPSNIKCVDLPYTLIGATHLINDEWIVFTTDDTHSEIGKFKESICSYEKIVNDDCLNFKKSNLITAANRQRYDCGVVVYWDDGLNPTRTLNIDDIPWKHIDTYVNGCLVRTYPTYPNGDRMLDCEAIRLAPLLTHPCIEISKGKTAGTLPNGSYQACIAYTVNQVKFTDYIGLTAVQGLFEHLNTASSLQIDITNIDKDFDEFELVILANINAQTVAKRIGYYSTSQGTIYIDRWDPEYETIPVVEVVFRSEPIEKSDAMYPVGPYLLRTGVYSKFKFNYQPLANQIRAKWVVTEYPQEYYLKGNHNTGYMRDEQYAFFIRFVYSTGEFSESYHIPGRPSLPTDLTQVSCFEGLCPKWKVENTASVTNTTTQVLPDGGTIIAKGEMGYWESTEKYPSDKPDIWNSFPNTPGSPLNLCGQNIRHHKMPDETIGSQLALFDNNSTNIRILGVEFENISWPLDENGQPIQSIVGYQILRGSREGNKTILAKGLINNMREYSIPGNSNVRGLFANYPYNDLRPDDYLTEFFQDAETYLGPSVSVSGGVIDVITAASAAPMSAYRKNIFSFHSPEVSFSSPFLSVYDLKIYSEYYGTAYGQFKIPYKHPKFKFITDFLTGVIDIVSAVLALKDLISVLLGRHSPDFDWNLVSDSDVNVNQSLFQKRLPDINYGHQKPLEIKGDAVGGGNISGNAFIGGIFGSPINGGAIRTDQTAEAYFNTDGDDNVNSGANPTLFATNSTKARNNANAAITAANFAISVALTMHRQITLQEQLYKLVLGLIPYRQYACQYNSYGFYNKSTLNSIPGNQRRQIQNAYYVGPGIQSFPVFNTSGPLAGTTSQYQINNLFRSRIVVFNVTNGTAAPDISNTVNIDQSRVIKSKANNGGSIDLEEVFPTPIASWYGAMRVAIPSQYGQLETIKQLVSSTCIHTLDITQPNATSIKYSSPVIFGGDTYINRFTEKNTMFFFDNWLMGELEGPGSDIDYTKYANIPWPRFWANTTNLNGQIWKMASRYRKLDDLVKGSWFVAKGYFYLFNSGVRDFFVESEVNVAYRDWEEDVPKRHYDPFRFTDYNGMFRSDVIKSGNYYKYDYSLSVSKLFNSHITWGNTLPRDYDPLVAANCYKYSPSLVIYSLPQTDEEKKDNWRAFLKNNQKEFFSKVTAIKSINKTGALFMMENQSPLSFMGVEELKLDGTSAKITIGDGKLFETGENQLQAITNADDSFEYGSNQSRYGSVNTTAGVFWVSQNQGKVFILGGKDGIKEISADGMRWWFARYLPSELLRVYPNYPLYDNIVAGVGVTMTFDNTTEVLYVSKRDFKPITDLTYQHPDTGLPYDNQGQFWLDDKTPISLTDPEHFEDAGWTASYDTKIQAWISFHDWIPTFTLPGKNHFLTAKDDSIWKHNTVCDSYCNFYGNQYPWEVEFVSSTGQQVNTVRSIEYILDAYKFHNDCRDRYHVLDEGFDQAIIYNSEQISGVLQLVPKAKNNPLALLSYPQVNANSISIQYSKEENKYRFNQFWDVTKNRGEGINGFPAINLPMFNTSANGYVYPINPSYIDYNKPVLERKKFRHYVNRVFLRRFDSGNVKFLFKISNQKNLQSLR